MDVDDILLLSTIQHLDLLLCDEVDELESLLTSHIREQRRLNRSLPFQQHRKRWSDFLSDITLDHFRRMFRMTLDAFNALCTKIEKKIGAASFASEKFLCDLTSARRELRNDERSIPLISGEVKVAISIRILAGGSYLDLVPLFVVSSGWVFQIFEQFLNWILSTFEFPLVSWLRHRSWDKLEMLANDFAEKSDGIFYGPFGACDGLAVRIRCPSLQDVPDPGNYYCRKGFYALNVQAICDRRKRFLWVYPTNKGSTHDSQAFTGSKLYDLLKELSNELAERGLFIVMDSAYSLTPFSLTPFDRDEMKSDPLCAKDSYNFHLSSCRIHIECSFGELVMRWGILWRTLQFRMHKCARIIQVTMLLHNFIIEMRDEDIGYFKNFTLEVHSKVQEHLTTYTGEVPRPLVTDNDQPPPRGRPPPEEHEFRQLGNNIRHRLVVKLAAHKRSRPMEHDMEFNSQGNIYMTSS